ncbi:MAG: hypothetical protein ACUVQK_14370 [Thermogutta sp.]
MSTIRRVGCNWVAQVRHGGMRQAEHGGKRAATILPYSRIHALPRDEPVIGRSG